MAGIKHDHISTALNLEPILTANLVVLIARYLLRFFAAGKMALPLAEMYVAVMATVAFTIYIFPSGTQIRERFHRTLGLNSETCQAFNDDGTPCNERATTHKPMPNEEGTVGLCKTHKDHKIIKQG